MRLEKLTLKPPPGAAEMLFELGDGENGFSGTSFGRGNETLANGGVMDRPGIQPDTGEKVIRYWVG